jgi:tetratricopeptide (TPR) repeat protein
MNKKIITFSLIFTLCIAFNRILATDINQPESTDVHRGENRDTGGEAMELLNQADSVFGLREYVNSRRFYQKALDAAKKAGDNSSMTEAMAMITRTYLIEKNMEIAVNWMHATEQIALEQEHLGWSRFQAVKGRFLWRENKLQEATKLFERLYEYCSKNKLHERAIDAAHMVAITGDYQEQINWGHKGIKEAEEGNVTGWLGPLWNNLGATFEDMGQYDSSLMAYRKARDYHYEHGTEANKMIADWAVGHAYLNLKDYDSAEKWLTPLIVWCQRLDDTEFLGLTAWDLGEVYYARGEPEKALGFYIVAEKHLMKAGMEDWDSEGMEEIRSRIAEIQENEN